MAVGAVTFSQKGPGRASGSRWPVNTSVPRPRGFAGNTNRPPSIKPVVAAGPRPGWSPKSAGAAFLAAMAVKAAVQAVSRYAPKPSVRRGVPGAVRGPNYWDVPGKGGPTKEVLIGGLPNSYVRVPDKVDPFAQYSYFLTFKADPSFPPYGWWFYAYTLYRGEGGLPVWPGGHFVPYGVPGPRPNGQPRIWPEPYNTPEQVSNPIRSRPNPALPHPDIGLIVAPNAPPKRGPPMGKPPKGVKEKKYSVMGAIPGWIKSAINSVTEGLDLWNAVVDAAGWEYDLSIGGGRFKQQWEYLIDNAGWKNIDGSDLLKNIIENEIEDRLIGGLNGQLNQGWLNSGHAGNRPVGISFGPAQ